MDKEYAFKAGKNGKFEFDRELTAVEILGIAIKAEVSSFGLYKRLAARIVNTVVKKRLLGLAEDEENHRIILSEKYTEMTGEELPPIPPTGDLRQVEVDIEKMSNMEVLKFAADKEANAQKFYYAAAEKVKDPGGKQMLAYLGEMEKTHEDILRQEIKQLDKVPLWHEQEAGQLFHVGP